MPAATSRTAAHNSADPLARQPVDDPRAVAPRPHQARLRQQRADDATCWQATARSRVATLVNRPLALGQHIDDLSPPSAAKRLRDRREGVKEGILRHAITHTIKLSFEYSGIKVPTALLAERSLDSLQTGELERRPVMRGGDERG